MLKKDKKILIFAFSNRGGTNISARTLKDTQFNNQLNIVYKKIFGDPKQFFKTEIEQKDYSLIIGLGDFSKKLTQIKIETITKNIYGKSKINEFSEEYLNLNLPLISNNNDFKISTRSGNSNCNLISFLIQDYINQNNLKTKFVFLHLPNKNCSARFAKNINNAFLLKNSANFDKQNLLQ